jgi:hypothetical protein
MVQWRKKVFSHKMTQKESILFGVKLAFQKKEHIYLRTETGELNFINLGPQITEIPDCLLGIGGRYMHHTPSLNKI